MNSRHRGLVSLGVVVIVLGTVTCSIALIPVGTGTLAGTVELEYFRDHPEEDTAGVDMRTILRLLPADGSEVIVLTETDGSFEVTDLPVGETVVEPVHMDPAYGRSTQVYPGARTEVVVNVPYAAVDLVFFNGDPGDGIQLLDDAGPRISLGFMIDRCAVYEAVGDFHYAPAVSVVPSLLQHGGWLEDVHVFGHLTETNWPGTDPPPTITEVTLTNCRGFDGTFNPLSMDTVVTGWNAYSTVTADSVFFDDFWNGFVPAVYMDRNFEAARLVAVYHTNNLLPWLEIYAGPESSTRINPTNYDALLNDGWAALDAGDLAGYEDAVRQLLTILREEGPVVPVLDYTPSTRPLLFDAAAGVWDIQTDRSSPIPGGESAAVVELDFETGAVSIMDGTGTALREYSVTPPEPGTISDQVGLVAEITTDSIQPANVGQQREITYVASGDLLIFTVYEDETRTNQTVLLVCTR